MARRASVFLVTFIAEAAATIVVVAALPFAGGVIDGTSLLWGGIAGLGGGGGAMFLYRGLARGSMSIVGPVSAVITAAGSATAGVALGERPGPVTAAGIVLACVAVALVSMSEPTGRVFASRSVARAAQRHSRGHRLRRAVCRTEPRRWECRPLAGGSLDVRGDGARADRRGRRRAAQTRAGRQRSAHLTGQRGGRRARRRRHPRVLRGHAPRPVDGDRGDHLAVSRSPPCCWRWASCASGCVASRLSGQASRPSRWPCCRQQVGSGCRARRRPR